MANGQMLRRDAVRVLAIQRGKSDRSYLGSILIHSEHPRGVNLDEFWSLIARGP